MPLRPRALLLGAVIALGAPAVGTATVSGGVNIYAGQTPHQSLVTWTGNSSLCHQGSGAITGRGPADSWWVSEFLWSCQVRGASIWTWNPTGGPFGTGALMNASIAAGSTVEFVKNDVQGLVTSFPPSGGTPADSAFPTQASKARWLVNGVVRQESVPSASGAQTVNFGANAGYGYPTEYYWYRTLPLSFSWTFAEPGSHTVELIVDYANGRKETVSGTVTVVGDAGAATGGVSAPLPAGADLSATTIRSARAPSPRFPTRVVNQAIAARIDCVHDRRRCISFFLAPVKVKPVSAAWARQATLSLRCEGVCPGVDQRRGEVVALARGGTLSSRLWGARTSDGRPAARRAFPRGARLVATLVAPGIRLTAVLPVTARALPFQRAVVERSLRWTEACALTADNWSCPGGTTPETGLGA